MKMKKCFKSEKGSITVFTLASCLFFLVSVMGVQAYTKNKEMAVEEDYKRIKEIYEKDIDNQAEIYNRIKDLTGDIGVNFEDQEGYLIPTGATSCTISQTFTVDNQSNNKVQSISYGWSTEPETQPTSWENVSIQSLTYTANKTGTTAGDYYLWVKVKHQGENEATSTRSNKITVYSDGITISKNDSNASITYPVSVNLYNKRIGQGETEQEAKARLQNNTNTTMAITSNVLYVEATDSHGNKIHKGYTPVEFATTNGRIDVVWVDTNNNVISSPLNVNNYLNGLTKTAWNSSNEEITPTSDSAWYNYTAGQNKWANAKNSDGSYFVWVPRYAYRITYLNDQNKPSGYFDGRGMVDLAGNIVTSANGATFTPRAISIIKGGVETSIMATVLDDGVNVVEYNGYQYIVHPAFETNLDLGGWSSDLPGFWCAKFEMSKEIKDGDNWVKSNNPTGSVETSSTLRAVSKPGISSWREIGITKCYTNSYNYDRGKESHLMKNSEWGAVAYLTHSQFGRNGQEVNKNNNKDYLTGYSGEGPNVSISSDAVETYDYRDTFYGVKASSTGNIYGIYDLSGGAYEYIAGFYSESTSTYVTAIKSLSEWENYATEYFNNTNSRSGSEIYNVGKIGDATKEVYMGYVENNYRNWNKDYSHYVYSENPFFLRGACITDEISGGIFCSIRANGINIPNVSFRVVMSLHN